MARAKGAKKDRDKIPSLEDVEESRRKTESTGTSKSPQSDGITIHATPNAPKMNDSRGRTFPSSNMEDDKIREMIYEEMLRHEFNREEQSDPIIGWYYTNSKCKGGHIDLSTFKGSPGPKVSTFQVYKLGLPKKSSTSNFLKVVILISSRNSWELNPAHVVP
ncbi:hypothetical protein P171DRAFT_491452 [Karstenula rhodostoma CBS 690.94]|uniref:Uncharacterized protein n=1 Tax=Karstenula rhodostoma CBS 690.94 TaxID=1392251 RepID=A0A9P4P7W4_9PLEO|nr:hypothetical protein P171DRAFT_491452 [Karstenula rhodostoma CBS 690.94]